MAVSARFVSRDKVMEHLRLIAPNAETEIAKMQVKVGKDMAGAMKQKAPIGDPKYRRRGRKPGTYRDSINAAKLSEKSGKLVGSIQQTKDPNAVGIFAEWIWHFIEFGTVRSRRQPHIFPTYRAERKNMKRRLARAMRNAIKKAVAGQASTSTGEGGD